MPKITQAVQFGCPDCRSIAPVDYIALEDDKIILLGTCPACNGVLKYDVDACISRLLGGNFVQTNGTKQ